MLLFSCCSLAVSEAGGLSPKDVGVVPSVLVRMHKALAASPMQGTPAVNFQPSPIVRVVNSGGYVSYHTR